MPWFILQLREGVHVLPVDEAMRHELDVGCACRPEIEHANPETGHRFRVPLVTHRE
jgi:hypothetical protein